MRQVLKNYGTLRTEKVDSMVKIIIVIWDENYSNNSTNIYWFYRTYNKKIKITSFKMATAKSIKKWSKCKGKIHSRTGHEGPEGE